MSLEAKLARLPAKERRLPKVFKSKWVKALRSGDYKQGKQHLFNDEGTFCCLGVACDMSGMNRWILSEEQTPYHVRSYAKHSRVPSLLLQPFEADNIVGILATMNDLGNHSFQDIANVIEYHC